MNLMKMKIYAAMEIITMRSTHKNGAANIMVVILKHNGNVINANASIKLNFVMDPMLYSLR